MRGWQNWETLDYSGLVKENIQFGTTTAAFRRRKNCQAMRLKKSSTGLLKYFAKGAQTHDFLQSVIPPIDVDELKLWAFHDTFPFWGTMCCVSVNGEMCL